MTRQGPGSGRAFARARRDIGFMADVRSVSLRPVSEADIAIFYEHQVDDEAVAMAAFPSRDFDTHAAHWKKVLRDENCICRTVVAGDQVVGNVVSWVHAGQQEIGYWIGRDHWGAGIATEALRAFLEVVIHRPLLAWVADHNVGSIRVLEKCGFTRAVDQPKPDERGVQYVAMELAAGSSDGNDRRAPDV